MTFPKFSIITPCLNRAAYIDEAIQSVLRQNYPDVEHIIVDGGSTDGTLEILARYPHLKVISEPDQGMYDALNKGLDLAQGEIVGFLNTDDLYAENAFSSAIACFNNANIQAVAGRAKFFRDFESTTFELSPPTMAHLVEESITGSTIFNAWFFKKDLLVNVGGFNSRYKISGDADIILRLALRDLCYVLFDQVTYIYHQHHSSLTMQLNSQKLLKIWDDHVLFRRLHTESPSALPVIRRQMNTLCANTCQAISSQYLKEKNYAQSSLWKCRSLWHKLIRIFV